MLTEELVKKETADASKAGLGGWRLPAIDGLRAMAMLMVFAVHAWGFSNSPTLLCAVAGKRVNLLAPLASFDAGVDLFMVLSGFCLFWPLCKSEQTLAAWDFREFYRRRIHRIVPPYYAAIIYATVLPVALVAAFKLAHTPAKWQPLSPLWDYAAHLLFLHTLFPASYHSINIAFWSLGLEAQFYLVFPLVVFGFRRFGMRFVVGIAILSVLYRIAGGVLTANLSYAQREVFAGFFLGRWMQFAFGMMAAKYVARHRLAGTSLSGGAGTGIFLFGFAVYTLAVSAFHFFDWPRSLLLGIAFALIVVALCCAKTAVRHLFENKTMVWFGFIAYSVFLIHANTLWFLSGLLQKKLHVEGVEELILLVAAGLPLIIGISYVFFLLFERPFLNFRRKKALTPSLPVA